MRKMTIPEIAEVLMSQVEDICLVCGQGDDTVYENETFWHVRGGVRRECRAHQIHRAIKRFEALEDAGREVAACSG